MVDGGNDAECSKFYVAKAGTQVIVPYRDEEEKRHLKVMGDLGQIIPMVCGRESNVFVVRAHSTVGMGHEERVADRRVSPTLGHRLQPRRKGVRDQVRVYPPVSCLRALTLSSRNYDFSSVHVTGAKSIASIAAHHGISKFVHVSHLNASLDSKSSFYRTKAEGELAVKEAFPESTIIRPSTMFGYEDRLLNNMAGT